MIEIILFIVALLARLLATHKEYQGFDSWGHLYYVKEVKRQKKGPFGTINTQVVGGNEHSEHLLWHWLVSFFPYEFVCKYQKFWNPIIDALFSVIIYKITFFLNLDYITSLLCFSLYLFSPMWFSRIAIGPRTNMFTPRLSGEIVTNLFLALMFLPIDMPSWVVYLVGSTLAAYVLASSKFGVQALLFITPPTSLLLKTWEPIIVLAISVLFIAIVSKGRAITITLRYLNYLKWYFMTNLKGNMQCSNRNRFDSAYSRRANESSVQYYIRILYMLIQRNSFTALVIKLPVLWVSLMIFIYEFGLSAPLYVWGPFSVGCILFILINIPQFLFLGEAERYLNHVAIFILLFACHIANSCNYNWLYWIIVCYGVIYLFIEVIIVPFVNDKKVTLEKENDIIINYLSVHKKSVVLCFPYYTGGGVWRIMTQTNHKVVWIAATRAETVDIIQKKYATKFPFVDLNKLDDMHNEFGVSLLICRIKDIDEQHSTIWKPSEKWNEINLGLKLHRIFVHSPSQLSI